MFRPTAAPKDINVNLDCLPLVELHVHADGGILSRELAEDLAHSHHLTLDPALGTEGSWPYEDFIDFLKNYDKVTSVIITAEDIKRVTYDYLKRCHQDGAIYIELGCSPDHLAKTRKNFDPDQHVDTLSYQDRKDGLSYPEFVLALAQGIEDAHRDFGIEARIKMVLLRHKDTAGCQKDIETIIQYPHPYVVGIDLAGDEKQFPARNFENIYAQAKAAGLHLSAHAGEHDDAQTMWDAIHYLGLERIGHGISAIHDAQLIKALIALNITLEISPSSNIAMKLCTSYQDHPFHSLYQAGVRVCLNSDDPAWFDDGLKQNYEKIQGSGNLTNEDMLKITRYAIEGSFASKTLKKKLLAQVTVYEKFQILNKLYQNIINNCLLDQNDLATLEKELKRYRVQANYSHAHALFVQATPLLGNSNEEKMFKETLNELVAAHQTINHYAAKEKNLHQKELAQFSEHYQSTEESVVNLKI